MVYRTFIYIFLKVIKKKQKQPFLKSICRVKKAEKHEFVKK